MPNATSTRRRGATATVLDREMLLVAAREQFPSQYPDFAEEAGGLTHGPGHQMLLETADGLAVVNSEGVGNGTVDGTISLHFSYGFTWTPVTLTVEQVEAAKTSETIDLADGIRTFGDRLDSNHFLWWSRATGH